SYKEMLTKAITELKERNGSSRQAIKKFIQSNFKVKDNFDVQFNQALRRGVEKGEFVQPKGPSGTVKLAKK
ncbi:histone H1/H5, partial [Ascobolus immersus RN42]